MSVAFLVFVCPGASADWYDPVEDGPFVPPMAAVAAGNDRIVSFGGWSGDWPTPRSIVEYDPVSGTSTEWDDALPFPRSGAQAVWTGSEFYVLGGASGHPHPEALEIVRYVPGSGAAMNTSASIPEKAAHAFSFWNDGAAYLMGGTSDDGWHDRIVRFTPDTMAVDVMPVTLPSTWSSGCGVWTGSHAYLFGGLLAGEPSAAIMEWNLVDPPRILSERLPTARTSMACLWSGERAYVVLGNIEGNSRQEIVEFDPSDYAMNVMNVRPHVTFDHAAAWYQGAGYVFARHHLLQENQTYNLWRFAVENHVPEVEFSESFLDTLDSPHTGDTFTIFANAFDPHGHIKTLEWDWGDGNKTAFADEEANANPYASHAYSRPGNYTIRVTAVDAHGASGTAAIQMAALNRPPSVSFPDPRGVWGVAGKPIVFDASATDPDGEVVEWSWDFGDGNISAVASPSHTYVAEGRYNVTVQVWDDHGAPTGTTLPVYVSQAAATTTSENHKVPGLAMLPVIVGAAIAVQARRGFR